MFARNPWNDEFGERVAFADLNGRQTAWTCDRTEFLGRDGALDRPLALTSGAHAVQSRRRRPRSLRRAADAGDTGCRGHDRKSYSSSAQSPSRAPKRKRWSQNTARPISTRCSPMLPSNGTTHSASCRSRRPIARWIFFSTAGCPIRPWPAGYGRATAFYQASGAYGFRDQLAGRDGAVRVAARHRTRAHLCAPRRGNSLKATSSIGGCRNPDAASARASPMTAAGWPMSSPTMSRSPATSRCWTRWFRFWKGRCCKTASATRSSCRRCPAPKASLFDHCALALDKSLETGAHGLPLMGTGDWNDGMDACRRRRQGRERLARLVPVFGADAFADLAERHDNPRARGGLASARRAR